MPRTDQPRKRALRVVARMQAFLLIAASLVAAAVVPATTRASAATWTQPSFVRAISGHGEPGVYAWGIAYNPVSNEVLVSDYLNFAVRRYDMNGNLLGSFYRTPNDGQPYSLAVDPRDGSIWVPENSTGLPQGFIAKYDKNGNFIKAIQTNPQNAYWVWIATDTQGNLYVVDDHLGGSASHPPTIRKFDSNGNFITKWGVYGSGPGQLKGVNGIATDAQNNVYLADPLNGRVSVFTSTGTPIRDFGSKGSGAGQFSSDIRGIAVDSTNNWVYVADAGGDKVVKFSTTGTYLSQFGSPGNGPGQFESIRQLAVGPGGDVYVADYGVWRYDRFSSSGVFRAAYPDPAEPAPQGFLGQPRDVAVDPVSNNVWVSDSWNERNEEFAPDGSFLQSLGHRDNNPPDGMDYPRGIGIDPATRNIWVANTRAQTIRIYDSNGNYLTTIGHANQASNNAGFFNWPLDIQFFGGHAYITSWQDSTVQVIDSTSYQQLFKVTGNGTLQQGVAVDPSTGNIYVASGKGQKVYVFDSTGHSKFNFGSAGAGDGQFNRPWGIDIVNGVVYVTDAAASRVQAFDLSGHFLGKMVGHGNGPYQMSTPSGITHDAAGNIYIADTGNDRILEYSTTVAKPTGDNKKPTQTITSPAPGTQVTLPVTITGTAADNFGVARVDVSIQNTDTGLWWNAGAATWSPTQTWNASAVAGASLTSVTWAQPVVGVVYNGHYAVQAQAVDVSSITSATVSTTTFTTPPPPPDTVPPGVTITMPTKDQNFGVGQVAIAGTASDDKGVSNVSIAVLDRNTSKWFDPNTGLFTSAAQILFPTTLWSPGSFDTVWSYAFNATTAPASYYVTAQATDTSNNKSPLPGPFTRFTIS